MEEEDGKEDESVCIEIQGFPQIFGLWVMHLNSCCWLVGWCWLGENEVD